MFNVCICLVQVMRLRIIGCLFMTFIHAGRFLSLLPSRQLPHLPGSGVRPQHGRHAQHRPPADGLPGGAATLARAPERAQSALVHPGSQRRPPEGDTGTVGRPLQRFEHVPPHACFTPDDAGAPFVLFLSREETARGEGGAYRAD